MGYCTIRQLEDRITASLLARRFTETGEDRTRVLEAYISYASARIDAFLSARYSVPVAQCPLLADVCLSLALWQIDADRATSGDAVAPARQVPYDNAVRLLERLASGEVKLPGDGAQDAPGAAAALSVRSPAALFADDSPGMEGF